jgi:hypothetical protein
MTREWKVTLIFPTPFLRICYLSCAKRDGLPELTHCPWFWLCTRLSSSICICWRLCPTFERQWLSYNSEHQRKPCTHRILSSEEQGIGVLYNLKYEVIIAFFPFVDHCLSEFNERFPEQTRPFFLTFQLLPSRVQNISALYFVLSVKHFA